MYWVVGGMVGDLVCFWNVWYVIVIGYEGCCFVCLLLECDVVGCVVQVKMYCVQWLGNQFFILGFVEVQGQVGFVLCQVQGLVVQCEFYVQCWLLFQQGGQVWGQEYGFDGIGVGQVQFVFQLQVFVCQGVCQLLGLFLYGVGSCQYVFVQVGQFYIFGVVQVQWVF